MSNLIFNNCQTRPRSSMVERVTSNDEVAGSIPSEGICPAYNFVLLLFAFASQLFKTSSQKICFRIYITY